MPLTPDQVSKPRKRSGKKSGAPKPPERPRPPTPAEIEAERQRRLRERARESEYDAVDEAGIESFPASDPPAFIGATI